MKNLNKINKSNKIKIYAGIIVTLLGITGIIIVAIVINNWYEKHTIQYQTPVEVSFQQPVVIEVRKPQVIEKTIVYEYPDELVDTPVKQRICEVFGQFNCQTAIAVASVEGLNHPIDSFNLNTNNTIDVGYFRINSVHFGQKGCSLAEVITEEGNIQCAYSIWKASGWSAWVGYNNGNYLGKL